MPTRAGRHALAFTRFGRINLKNARHADDPRPLDEASDCPAARDYSRAYLHHLIRCDEMLGSMLLTWVNLAYYQSLMAGIRAAIDEGRFESFKAEVQGRLGARGYRRAVSSVQCVMAGLVPAILTVALSLGRLKILRQPGDAAHLRWRLGSALQLRRNGRDVAALVAGAFELDQPRGSGRRRRR